MVAADVHPGGHLSGCEGAVLLGPDLESVPGGIAAVVVQIFLPALQDLYRFSRFQCQSHGDEDHRIGVDAAAEVAASADADDVHLVQGDVEQLPQKDAGIVQGLGGGPDRDPPVSFRTAGAASGFHLAVVDPGGDKLVFHDHIRLGEAGLRVPFYHFPGAGDVVLNLDFLILNVDSIVDQIVLRGHGLVHVEVSG